MTLTSGLLYLFQQMMKPPELPLGDVATVVFQDGTLQVLHTLDLPAESLGDHSPAGNHCVLQSRSNSHLNGAERERRAVWLCSRVLCVWREGCSEGERGSVVVCRQTMMCVCVSGGEKAAGREREAVCKEGPTSQEEMKTKEVS